MAVRDVWFVQLMDVCIGVFVRYFDIFAVRSQQLESPYVLLLLVVVRIQVKSTTTLLLCSLAASTSSSSKEGRFSPGCHVALPVVWLCGVT